jgi:hypothetical protein
MKNNIPKTESRRGEGKTMQQLKNSGVRSKFTIPKDLKVLNKWEKDGILEDELAKLDIVERECFTR